MVAYSPLVKFVAGPDGRGLPSHVEESDLISYGLLGLIGAIERFEPEREIKFETFAVAADQGRDHRRAALARLGAALGARSRARDIEEAHAEARARAAAGADRRGAGRQARRSTEDELQEALLEIANSSILALEDLWTIADPPATRSRCSTRSRTRARRSRRQALDTSELKDRLRRDRVAARSASGW